MKIVLGLFLFIITLPAFAQVDTFRVKKATEKRLEYDLSATLGGRAGGAVTAIEARSLCCVVLNRDDIGKVVSFSLTVVKTTAGDAISFESINNMLTPDMINALGILKAGDTFYIEDIRVNGNNGISHMMAPLSFKIKAE